MIDGPVSNDEVLDLVLHIPAKEPFTHELIEIAGEAFPHANPETSAALCTSRFGSIVVYIIVGRKLHTYRAIAQGNRSEEEWI